MLAAQVRSSGRLLTRYDQPEVEDDLSKQSSTLPFAARVTDSQPSQTLRQALPWLLTGTVAALALGAARSAHAQVAPAATDQAIALATEPTLPNAPGYSSSAADTPVADPALDPAIDPAAEPYGGQARNPKIPPVAGRYDTVILPQQTAPRLTAGDKLFSSAKESISPFTIVGWFLSAGYEQVTNGSPNFPQTGTGFAQRLGSAAARNSSEEIFGYGVIAAATHQDPRYYKLGDGHSFIHRLFYAGTRTIISRTDSGHATLNFAELGGDLSGSFLTRVYYPPLNQTTDENLKTFAGSIGGSALGFVVSEFLSDTLEIVHLKKQTD